MRFKPTEIATIAVAGIALVGSITAAFYTYANRNRELDIKLVEIGIGILRTDPKDTGLTAARGWAVQVIEDNSRVKFSTEDRLTLLNKPLLYRSAGNVVSRDLEAIFFITDALSEGLSPDVALKLLNRLHEYQIRPSEPPTKSPQSK